MRPIDIRDPASPLGLTFGQELQDRIERELAACVHCRAITDHAPGCITRLEVPPSGRTVKNLQRRGQVIE
jgi:hypothetical protein